MYLTINTLQKQNNTTHKELNEQKCHFIQKYDVSKLIHFWQQREFCDKETQNNSKLRLLLTLIRQKY